MRLPLALPKLPAGRFSPERLAPSPRAKRPRAPEGLSAAVVGGGLAGMAAATVLAERGVRVTVIEREPFLGGRVGAWRERLADGEPFDMERGFHAFFRQYYNLRALLRRVDPRLERLRRLEDYPIHGPGGSVESFSHLPALPPFNLISLVRRSPSLRLMELRHLDVRSGLAMLAFDMERTYATFDHRNAREYLDSLRFPPHARRMLFNVFSHSFFNPEEDMSAAELLMMFHFYFMGNPEGLVFDVLDESFASALWHPLRRYLEERQVRFRLGQSVTAVNPRADGGVLIQVDGEEPVEADAVVLATTVPALQRIVTESPELLDTGWREKVLGLSLTSPFAVWRLWLDRPSAPGRHPFVGTTGLGIIDNISLYHLFEGESRRWAARTGGSVVELHAYGLPLEIDEASVRRELLGGLHALYPELRDARTLEERFLLRRDCPSFAPGSFRTRPTVETPSPRVALAGDFVRLPIPTALMERATTSGFMAANHLLAGWDIQGEEIWSVPRAGLLAGLATARAPGAGVLQPS
ncbi:FAD-dependent oxidoreductase [Archangium violaceum]|uniref:FAD-dependent oxidoreductase n=1 Tax=Archangium violaceum TaxID=83451 RepID=UPI00193B3A0C|nr:FAD-dependent oxidoreductase [Archangium violaceum]QRK06223.1 FAD-dependent oxidoreductase [Archangium violaceum]